MPKRSRKSKKKKRGRKKKGRRSRNTGVVSIGRSILPRVTYVTLPYADTFPLIMQSPDYKANAPYKCNGIFDPQYLTGGHQPLGRDQWEPFYDYYQVISARVAVSYDTSAPSSLIDSIIIGITKRDETQYGPWLTTENNARMEDPSNVWKKLIKGSVTRTQMLSMSWNSKRWFSYHTGGIPDQTSGGAVSNFFDDPSGEGLVLFNIWAFNAHATDHTVRCVMKINYRCKFTSPSNLFVS